MCLCTHFIRIPEKREKKRTYTHTEELTSCMHKMGPNRIATNNKQINVYSAKCYIHILQQQQQQQQEKRKKADHFFSLSFYLV